MLLYGTLLYVVPVYLGLVIVSPEYKYMASSCTVFYESLFTAKTLIVHFRVHVMKSSTLYSMRKRETAEKMNTEIVRMRGQ